jgi:hypothetical protein
MSKNNKKLTMKVGSLARKVQNLQAKLAVAEALPSSVPIDPSEFKVSPPMTNLPSARRRSNPLSPISLATSLSPFVPPSPDQTNRVASGSALPKAPERKALQQVKAQQTPGTGGGRLTIPLKCIRRTICQLPIMA